MKHTYIFGSIALSALLLIGLTVGLIAGGVIGGGTPKLVFQSASAEAVYNGAPLQAGEWSLVEGELQEGHTVHATVLGAQTDVGQSENIFSVVIYDENGADVSSDYVLEYIPGTLTVTPLAIELLADSASKQYDGTPLSCTTYKISKGALVEGHSLQVSMEAKRVEVGQTENHLIAYVFDANAKDVTHNYSISCISGDLIVISNAITVQSGNAEKIYDGVALTLEDAKLTAGALMEGHELSVIHTGTLTDAGKVPNTFAVEIHDAKGNNITQNYAITTIFGELRVLPRSVTVRTEDAAKDYDGVPLTCPDWRIVSQTGVAEGHTLEVIVSGTRTEVGESPNTVAEYIVTDEEGNNVTKNYDFSGEELGSLVINDELTPDGRRPLTVTAGSAEKLYDGQPLTEDSYTLTEPAENVGLRAGDTIEVVIDGSRTEGGISPNIVASVVIRNEEGVNVTDLYQITKVEGTLTVYWGSVIVTANSAEKTYDGTPLTDSGFTTATEGINQGLADGHEVFATVTGSITKVGTTDNVISDIVIKDADGNDVTDLYKITPANGVLEVLPPDSAGDGAGGVGLGNGGDSASDDTVRLRVRATKTGSAYLRGKSFGSYTGKGWSSAVEYDQLLGNVYSMNYLVGMALAGEGFLSLNMQIESLAGQYFLPYYLTPSTDYEIQKSDVYFEGDTDNAYEISYYAYEYRGVISLVASVPAEYAAAEQAYREFVYKNYLDVAESTRATLNQIIEAQGFHKDDVNIIQMVASYIQGAATYNLGYPEAMDAEEDIVVAFLTKYREGVCRHYASAATLLYRALGIPARYTTGYHADTVANEWVDVTKKQAHAWVEVYLDGFGWVQVEVTGGSSDGIGGSGGSAGEGEKEEPIYELTLKPSTLDMKYDGISVLDASVTKPKLLSAELEKLLDRDFTYKVSFAGVQSEIGYGISRIVEFVLYDPQGNDVTDQYSITYKEGRLHVYFKEITVQSGSKEQVYSGLPLLPDPNDYTVIGDMIYSTHTVTVTFSEKSQIIDPGEAANRFTATVYDGDRDVTYMYKIKAETGTLKVTYRKLVITADSANKEYDGTPLTAASYQMEGDLCDGHTITVVVVGSQTQKGRSDNVIYDVRILDQYLNNVTDNYAIQKNNGILRVVDKL